MKKRIAMIAFIALMISFACVSESASDALELNREAKPASEYTVKVNSAVGLAALIVTSSLS